MAVMAKTKPKHVVIYLCFRIFSFFVFMLPLRCGLGIGQGLGRLAFRLFKKARLKALKNLDASFANSRTREEKEFIAEGVFENLGKNIIEIICLSKFDRNNIDAYIKCKGLKAITGLIEKGKGGVVLSAHFGNWELIAHYFGIKGYSVNVIARRVRMGQFENFLAKARKRNSVKILYRDASAKETVALLKKNEFVGVMPDQDMDSVSGVFVDFFGRKAFTPNGPAVLNLMTGVPIIPCFIVRKDFGHEIVIDEPIELSTTGDRRRDILENTQRYTKVIEDQIRKYPSQWVWFHDRWKTKEEQCA